MGSYCESCWAENRKYKLLAKESGIRETWQHSYYLLWKWNDEVGPLLSAGGAIFLAIIQPIGKRPRLQQVEAWLGLFDPVEYASTEYDWKLKYNVDDTALM